MLLIVARAGNSHIRNSHAVLDAILFRRFHADQLKTVPCNFTELAELFWGNEGTSDKVKFVKVGNPFGILFVGFLTFDGLDVFRVCKAHINIVLEIIKNRNPILVSGFHTDMISMILDKLVVKPLDIRVDG